MAACPGDGEIRNEFKQRSHDLTAFLQAAEQAKARRPITQ
jgi:hypothetical protein